MHHHIRTIQKAIDQESRDVLIGVALFLEVEHPRSRPALQHYNGMLLTHELHRGFRELQVWLDACPVSYYRPR
jgi:hypothetical protein